MSYISHQEPLERSLLTFVHTCVRSFSLCVGTVVKPSLCQALCGAQSVQMHWADLVHPSWSSQHSHTPGFWQLWTPLRFLPDLTSLSDADLLSDASLPQPESQQPGFPPTKKKSSEIDEDIHRAPRECAMMSEADFPSPLTLHLHRHLEYLSPT